MQDRLEVRRARGQREPGLDLRAAAAARQARQAVASVAGGGLSREDARGLAVMRRWLSEVEGLPETVRGEPGSGFQALARQIMDDYAAAEGAVEVGGHPLTRLAVLGRLAEEDDPGERRRLFLALEPVWRSIAGDGGPTSPYRRLARVSAERWAREGSPVDANAHALGMDAASVEQALTGILQAWRRATGPAADGPVAPWDWWYQAGAAARSLRGAIPLDRLLPVARAYHAALGADLADLGVSFDVEKRPGRPPVPVAYTTFGGRPRRGAGNAAPGARPWVFATYTAGGLGELTELIHEVGHAIHIAGITARPAFADWPDSDAFTEALAELLALDTAEPAWQNRWLGVSAPEGESLRGRYAEVVLDVCWALFEIRMHADPDRSPDEVWAELTATYLGIAEHPEWPWWAMRGQLAEAPGYMSNYAIGPILAADLRAAIRAVRGDWTAGDPGWYPWVREHIFQWGLARSSGDALRSALGRPPSANALLGEISRSGQGTA